MGVPSLFRYITDQYPDTVRSVSPKDETDMLYIDFNAVIHRCCKPPTAPQPKDESTIFENVRAYLVNAVQLVNPKILVYISTDGVAPRAKLNQQRARRYHSSLEAMLCKKLASGSSQIEGADEISAGAETTFESNCITPGTDFMKRLDEFINEFLKYQLTHEWKELSVIYSSSNVPGEGEQKILDFIKSQKNFSRFKHTIYSPDADLIFFGLSLHKMNVKLMRNDNTWEAKQKREFCTTCQKKGHSVYYCGNYKAWKYVYFDIEVLKRHLHDLFSAQIKRKFVFDRIVDDWIFLCFLAGNDFIPTLQCFDIRFGALENILFVLTYNFNGTSAYITESGNVNFASLRNVLNILAKNENTYYYKKLDALREARRRMFTSVPGEEIWLHTVAGKKKYYEEKLGAKSDADVTRICSDYLRCLSWIFHYYYVGVKSWDFYYPHHFAPFAKDLASISSFDFKFEMGRPLKPLEQLMAVMPPLSRELLPPPMRVLFEEFKEFYPPDIKVDMFDKLLAWQGVALLPFFDIKLMLPRVKEIVDGMDLHDVYKNIKGNTLLYVSENNAFCSALSAIYSNAENGVTFDNKSFSGKIHQYHNAFLPGKMALFGDRQYENRTISVIFDNIK